MATLHGFDADEEFHMTPVRTITDDQMGALKRLADIAREIDVLRDGMSKNIKTLLGLIAAALHLIVEIKAGNRAAEIYAPEDTPE